MKQGHLFGGTDAYGAPIAATTDPASSHLAAERITASGKRASDAAIVLAVIQRCPGLTVRELWSEATDDERSRLGEYAAMQKRVSDLIAAGKVRRVRDAAGDVMRTCAVTGNQATVVEAVS